MVRMMQSPRRYAQMSHYNWQSRYTGLNNKIAFYELRMLELIKGVNGTPQEKRAYTLALHAWKRYVNQLTKHMENPV